METVFYSYTIIIMLVCAGASTAMATSYAITRNRVYFFAAIAFVLYFFDLTFIFQSEYLNHGMGIEPDDFYTVNDPLIKTVIAAGILESLWCSDCFIISGSRMPSRQSPRSPCF